jgi:uncharacterized protein DUF6884/GIY-YIG catalytic domain-containing protein
VEVVLDSASPAAVLVGCVSGKEPTARPARELYRTPLFRARRRYAEASGLPWLIVSALYGIVDPDEVIEPYNVQITDLDASARRDLAEGVVATLEDRFGELAGLAFEVHAGDAYVQMLELALRPRNATLLRPLRGLGIGKQLGWYAARRRGESLGPADAIQTLRSSNVAAAASAWTAGDASSLGQPGLYSWWADAVGARDLSEGLGASLAPGLIYAGQTGATKWPSGTVGKGTLAGRIGRQHLRGRVRGSTFRLTLAAALCRALDLRVTGPGTLAPESEQALTDWMLRHLSVIAYPCADRNTLRKLEDDVLDALDPPLNLEGRPPTPLRAELSSLRAGIAAGESCATRAVAPPTPRGPARRAPGRTSARRPRTTRAGRQIDARRHLERLIGTTVYTIARDEPNRILRIEGDVVLVGTRRSPSGTPVPVEWVQEAIDRLIAAGELEMTTRALGAPIGYRSAFLGAALRELDGVEVMSRRPARVRRHA